MTTREQERSTPSPSSVDDEHMDQILHDDDDEEEEEEDDEDCNDRYFDTSTMSHNMTDLSLAELIHKQMERISTLEQSHVDQGTNLFQLQQELTEQQIQHKKQVQLLQMDLDQTTREKAAGEERMGELYHDLMEIQDQKEEEEESSAMVVMGDDGKPIDDPRALAVIKALNEKIQKYEKTFGVMDNQVAMIKTSCEQVVKTLKDEIADMMEDRCHMEIDLLNQVARLENEKETLKKELDPERYVILEKAQSFRHISTDSFEEKLQELRDERAKLEHLLNQERQESDYVIARMEESNQSLQTKLEVVTTELTILQSKPESMQTAQVLEKVAQERLNLANMLDELAILWERADTSVSFLEDLVDRFQESGETKNDSDDDHGRFLTTLESAALVHNQVKISLLLLELKLRNQLTALSNDQLAQHWTDANQSKMTAHLDHVRKENVEALEAVKLRMEEGLKSVEKRVETEVKFMKKSILQRTNAIQCIQIEHKKFQRDLDDFQHQEKWKSNDVNPPKSPKAVAKGDSITGHSPVRLPVGESVLDQLQSEVLKTVERLKMKDNMILLMKEKIDESTARERILKKELKRVMKKAKADVQRKVQVLEAEASLTASGATQKSATSRKSVSSTLVTSRRSEKSSPDRASSFQSGSSRDPPAV